MGVGMPGCQGRHCLILDNIPWALDLSLPICKMGLGWFIPEPPFRPEPGSP